MIMSKETVFDKLCDQGAITSDDPELLGILEELSLDGVAVRMDLIPHAAEFMNPGYTYVTDDEAGRHRALTGTGCRGKYLTKKSF